MSSFADYLLDKFPFRIEAIQTDNGSEYQSAFHWHLADRGIRHICIKPATPRLKGKVERSHRTTLRSSTNFGTRSHHYSKISRFRRATRRQSSDTRISTTLEIYTDVDEEARLEALTRLHCLLDQKQS